ncbi:hypothetical protein M231_07924 [Tremella mesenterica]|uniref:4Fe-4S ferredoxin-type domain-containing protein n=1 Tax=Tremella mesenterica TaxID=5217 RepID=A0A4Q1BFJ8_TREME|nr:hypothetical protein M231_07924 [Tremella mesenterica]
MPISDDASSGPSRRKRVALNCEECRRTKAKCLADRCPSGVLKPDPPKKQTIARLEARIAELERLLFLSQRGHSSTYPPSSAETFALPSETESTTFSPYSSKPLSIPTGFEDSTIPIQTDQYDVEQSAHYNLPPVEHFDITHGNNSEASSSGQSRSFADVQALDLASIMGRLTLSASGRRQSRSQVGGEGVYVSPDASSEEDEPDTVVPSPTFLPADYHARRKSKAKETTRRLAYIPWARRGNAYTSHGSLPAELLERCVTLLPGRKTAEEIFNKFWEATSWRIQPMTPSYFHNRILSRVYDSVDGAHPHDLGVLFAVIAIHGIFNDTSRTYPRSNHIPSNDLTPSFNSTISPASLHTSHPSRMMRSTSRTRTTERFPTPQDYHDLAYACLAAGHFYTDTTLSSLITLHLICQFMVNSDDRRLLDSISPILGLALRLATVRGYHQEPNPGQMSSEDMNNRRRIWYELLSTERAVCMSALSPMTIRISTWSTQFPSDVPTSHYLWWKWTLGKRMGDVVDYWTMAVRGPESDLLAIDASVRRLWHALPPHLRCPVLPANSFSLVGRDKEFLPSVDTSSGLPGAGERLSVTGTLLGSEVQVGQQYRLAQHVCMVFAFLHRPLFMAAIMSGGALHPVSMHTIIETCQHVVTLVESIFAFGEGIFKWFSWTADLFVILSCQTALIIKTPLGDPSLRARMSVLERGVAILERVTPEQPTMKHRALLHGARKMLDRARTVHHLTQDLSVIPSPGGPIEHEWLDQLIATPRYPPPTATSRPSLPVSMRGGTSVVGGDNTIDANPWDSIMMNWDNTNVVGMKPSTSQGSQNVPQQNTTQGRWDVETDEFWAELLRSSSTNSSHLQTSTPGQAIYPTTHPLARHPLPLSHYNASIPPDLNFDQLTGLSTLPIASPSEPTPSTFLPPPPDVYPPSLSISVPSQILDVPSQRTGDGMFPVASEGYQMGDFEKWMADLSGDGRSFGF